MLGRKWIIMAVFAFLSIKLSAKENVFIFKPLFGGGGVTAVFDVVGGYGLGGMGEVSFLFYDKGLQISNHFVGSGDSITTDTGIHYGTGSIMEKLSIGGFFQNNKFRSYAFVEGGIGFGGGNEVFAMDVLFGGGGGIDFFFHQRGSIYLEAGYLQHYYWDNNLIGGISISIGIVI